ncbi:hypothetical protein CMUS01_16543 [Colletotrichum musicola]|uniref:Uncharacterized protein n=1 Tax=Colletotrichum musicola TaxID=2175873 RepID=A0A8H6IMA3_9PEZI|nr:hypothetical protein CMUS01_16543 [Colletotrichum musicola]
MALQLALASKPPTVYGQLTARDDSGAPVKATGSVASTIAYGVYTGDNLALTLADVVAALPSTGPQYGTPASLGPAGGRAIQSAPAVRATYC